MSFDLAALSEAVRHHGRVARIVVAGVQGSAPREAGAAMLVWDGGQQGTIGGGALELAATRRAREALASGDRLDRVPLGPDLGQCCGGAVTLLTEVWDAGRLAGTGDVVARPVPGGTGAAMTESPLPVRRRMAALRNGSISGSAMLAGWMIEPVLQPSRELWIWGAGHVGRAIAGVMAPLPDWRILWADTSADRFPEALPPGVAPRIYADLPALVPQAAPGAHHLILTYSHAIDLALCHALLARGFGSAGLIGSDTKWARFRSRLRQLGHQDAEISRICCPIGRKTFGKHPQAIALGVAADLVWTSQETTAARDSA